MQGNVICEACPEGEGTGGATGAQACQPSGAPVGGCCVLPTSVLSTTYDSSAPYERWSYGHSWGWEGNAFAEVRLR